MQRSSREASITSQTDNVPSAHETVTSVANSLDELTDAELVKTVEDLQVETVHLDLENQVFENFLQKNDPALIVGMGLILDLAIKMQLQSQTQSTLAPPLERRDTGESARGSSRRTDSVVKFATTASMSERGPRINVSQKMDLAMREMEEMQVALEEFIKVSHKSKCNLKAELEEIGIRETEVNEARDIFEHKIVTEGVDLLTQRIPAEKFIRYMDEWLKSAESTIEKMRLRTSTLKAMFTKVTHQLIQKEELGEAIDAVDFDQLRIENQHLAEKIEQKNTHLLELKRMNGMANLVLTTNKQYLQKQVQELQSIKDSIKRKEERIVQLDKESEDVEKEVIKVKDKYEKIVNTAASYKVPDTMEYLKTRAKLADLKKNVKIFERKNHILHFALSTCVRQMKNLTGIKTPHSSWFEFKDLPSENSFSSLDDKMCVEGKASISS